MKARREAIEAGGEALKAVSGGAPPPLALFQVPGVRQHLVLVRDPVREEEAVRQPVLLTSLPDSGMAQAVPFRRRHRVSSATTTSVVLPQKCQWGWSSASRLRMRCSIASRIGLTASTP